ncbi:protease pro-enzyme activation domain-containing protein [uncultured Secundilactobacillus sp.]|uniref:protease pro-enzyme activation domain-containing protein n=1 Tax=uncultured Secundilactobacillus sp. TaxID=2813935 RepID=UPI0025857D4A|nr:protease pro-enzyme activation domain-containing protein [uncultured Secundilactobacillus sp.]
MVKAVLITALTLGLLMGSFSDSASAKKSPKISISVILKGQDESGLKRFAYDVSTPGNANFRKFLTPSQVATKYGASTHAVKAVQGFFKKNGIKSQVVAGNLSVTVKGSYAKLGRVLKAKAIGLKNGDYYTRLTYPKSVRKYIKMTIGYSKAAPKKKRSPSIALKLRRTLSNQGKRLIHRPWTKIA